MLIHKSPLITCIKGSIKAGAGRMSFRTTPSGKTAAYQSPMNLPLPPENSIKGYIQQAWSECDARWRALSDDAKWSWNFDAAHYYRGGRSGLDQFKSINLRRLICCMPGLNWPPRLQNSWAQTLAGTIITAILPEGYFLLVYTHGDTCEPKPFTMTSGDWPVPHPQIHPYCICNTTDPGRDWCNAHCPEKYRIQLDSLIAPNGDQLGGTIILERTGGCIWSFEDPPPFPVGHWWIHLNVSHPLNVFWIVRIHAIQSGVTVDYTLPRCIDSCACGFYPYHHDTGFAKYPDHVKVYPA